MGRRAAIAVGCPVVVIGVTVVLMQRGPSDREQYFHEFLFVNDGHTVDVMVDRGDCHALARQVDQWRAERADPSSQVGNYPRDPANLTAAIAYADDAAEDAGCIGWTPEP